jgi:hypothetical protein
MANVLVNGVAKSSTLRLTSGMRALGRMAEMNLGESMDDSLLDAQSIKDLGSDSFWEYLTKPMAKEAEEIPVYRAINRRLLDWTTASPSWEKSKASANGSMLLSSISAQLLTQYLVSDENVRKALEEQKKAEEQQQQAETSQKEADDKKEQGDDKGAAEAQKKADKAKEKADQHAQSGQSQLDKLEQSPFGQAIRANAVKQAKDGTDEAKSIITGWGMEDGENGAVSGKEILDILKKYKDFLGKITPLIGRVKGIAIGAKAKSQQRGNVVIEDGYTQKLNNIFPSEIALLRLDAHAGLRAVKMGEYCDRGLIGMVEGNESVYEGGLVIAVDESGSMKGERLIKAKALSIGIAEAAKANHQPYALFSFSNSTNGETVTDKDDFQTVMKWSQSFIDGGTNYDSALQKAMNIINGMGERASKTDFVLISDGECAIANDTVKAWTDLKDLYGTRLVFLGVDLKSAYTKGSWGGTGQKTIDEIASVMLDMVDTDNLDKVASQLSEALVRPQD